MAPGSGSSPKPPTQLRVKPRTQASPSLGLDFDMVEATDCIVAKERDEFTALARRFALSRNLPVGSLGKMRSTARAPPAFKQGSRCEGNSIIGVIRFSAEEPSFVVRS